MVPATSAQPAIAALPPLEIDDSLQKFPLCKVRPQDISHPDLAIRDLPKQKIAQPHLAAGANQQVGIRQIAGVEVAAETLFGDGLRIKALVPFQVCRQTPDGVNQFRASAV